MSIDKFTKFSSSDLEKWQLVDDVCEGSQKVKAAGTKYLPRPNPSDTSKEELARYKQYNDRAVFMAAAKSTLLGMVGLAFKKSPSIELPDRLEQVKMNANGNGVSLQQCARKSVAAVLKKGREGLLVDYPVTESAVSVLDEQQRGIRPTISRYTASSIKSWRKAKFGATEKLSLVVLEEAYTEYDGYNEEQKTQYRELLLDDAGLYLVNIHRDLEDGEGFRVVDSYQPTDGTGSRLDEIPFYFIGSENNDEEIDDAPLYDLCVLNIAHYRNSADYEEGVFICGQPWVYVSGLTAEWFKDQMGGKIKGGSGNGIPLPKDGSMGIIQAQPNTIAKEAMDQKEDQMIKLGARLIEQGSANKTATQSENDNATSHSVLSLVCENVSQAYEQAIKMCARFMNEDDSAIEYRINLDAGMKSIDAQALNAVVAAWMQRAFGRTQLLRALRRMDLVDPDKTDEELLDEIDQQVI